MPETRALCDSPRENPRVTCRMRMGKQPQLETASPSLLIVALSHLAKVAATSNVCGLVSREIRAGRGVDTSTPARRAREGIGGGVWGG